MESHVPSSRTSNRSVPSHLIWVGRYCPPNPPPREKDLGASASPSAILCSRSCPVDQFGNIRSVCSGKPMPSSS
eukprot:12256562-Prorocentrum_lima.AAC.1